MPVKPIKKKETAFRSDAELIKQVEARIKNGNKVNQEDSMKYIKAKGLKGQALLDFYDKNMSQGFSMKNPSKWEQEVVDPNYKAPTTDTDIKNYRNFNSGVESMKADSVPSQLKQYLLNTGYTESNKFGSGDTLEGKRIFTRAKSVGINPEIDAEGNFKLADDVNTFKDTDKSFGKTRTINPKAKYVKKVYTKGNDIVNNYELAVPPTYEGKIPTEQELKDFDAGTFYQVGATSNMKKVYVPYLDPKKIPQDSEASTVNANNQEMVDRYNTAQSYADQMNAYKKTDEYKNTQERRAKIAKVKNAFSGFKIDLNTPRQNAPAGTMAMGGIITTPREDMYANGGMIKRADGSYSQRGLWDNIRANKGSGKEPTKEMLKQERKINAKYTDGGRVLPKFNQGGNWKGVDASGNAIQTNFANSTAGKNVVTGAGIAGAAVPMLTSFIPDDRITDSEGNEIGYKENMGKGILNSAAQGASMGAVAGPVGALVGAGAGAIYGGIKNFMGNRDVDDAQKQANIRIQNKNLSNKLLTNQNSYSVNSYNNDQMIAANGGTVINEDMSNPNAELELNETFRDPMTGETGMVDGPSHDNGGIEMSLNEGTQIWSDRLKHNGKTFAKLTKPIINKISNLEKGLDSNPNSRFKQNSIKLLNAQLDFFFNVQESNKQQDEMKRTLKKQEGGVVDDMGNYHYANGGIYIKPENRGKFTAYKERTGKTTEEALHSPNAHVRQMANFAKNAAGWKHAMGGMMEYAGGGVKRKNISTSTLEPRALTPFPSLSQKDISEQLILNNAGDNLDTPIPKSLNNFDSKNYNTFMGGFKNDLNNVKNYKMGFGQPNENAWDRKEYSFGPNGAGGDQYTFDKIGKPTYQEPTAQTQNNSRVRRNNTGELIQAAALAGSSFAQLNNINRQPAPGIRSNVRLTGAIPNPRYVDLSAERGAINRSAMNAMGDAQRSFGNSASAQAFKNKARINQLEGAGKSYQAQENLNSDIYNKFAGMQGEAAMKEALVNNEIENANLENRANFNRRKMIDQNTAYGTLGHGVGDIGRNRTIFSNDMEKANVLSNQYEDSVLADIYKRNPQLLEEAYNNGQISKNKYNQIKNMPKQKYGGVIKKRSLKY